MKPAIQIFLGILCLTYIALVTGCIRVNYVPEPTECVEIGIRG